jgi:peptidyl-prolyl cis-trans isomerase SurA
MRALFLLPLLVPDLQAAVVLDRIAAVVNGHPIKTSDIERDLRLTDFLNKATLKLDAADKKAAEERLIDQQIIRGEIASGGYRRAGDANAEALLRQIRRDRFANSDVSLQRALVHYGLTEDQLRAQLLWQLTVLGFINERFRAGVLVSDDDVQKYYDQHRAELRAPLQTVSGTIRTALEGEQVNQQFDMWLDGARRDAQIDYKAEAIQ